MPLVENKERIQKLLFRGLLGAFPIFGLVVYLLCIHFPRQELNGIRDRLSKVGDQSQVSKEERERRRTIRKQRKNLRTTLSRFASSVKGVGRSSVGYQLSRLAKEARLKVNSISFSSNTGQGGWQLLSFSMDIEGEWGDMLRYLGFIRSRPEYLVSFEQLTMKGSPLGGEDEKGHIKANANVVALVKVPWEVMVAEEDTEGQEQSAGGGEASPDRPAGEMKTENPNG